MLILSRKKDERIIISDDIKIQIVDVKADTVKIGIEAPNHIKVYREELWSNIQQENKAAANTKDTSKSILEVNKELTERLQKKALTSADPTTATSTDDSKEKSEDDSKK